MRLISADELTELYDGCDGLSVPIAVVRQNIEDALAIDAEPVVRCGECKHFNGEIPYHYCRKAGGNFKIDSFCSYGERRAE